MNTLALVLGILLVVALVQAAIWIPLGLHWRRAGATFWDAFGAGVEAGAETVVLPVQPAIYRGATGPFSQVKGNGRIVLTTQRLLFRKVTGGLVEIPVTRITGVHTSKVFNGSVVGGQVHLVVEIDDGSAVGYFVTDLDGWTNQLQHVAGR